MICRPELTVTMTRSRSGATPKYTYLIICFDPVHRHVILRLFSRHCSSAGGDDKVQIIGLSNDGGVVEEGMTTTPREGSVDDGAILNLQA